MSLSIYNTLSERKETFKPLEPGKVGMYVCGVTVYDMCHIGHARAYVAADVIYRWLKISGFQVTYVRNFTDIDDKIIKRAAELGISTKELAERYIREFNHDMEQLGVQKPTVEPRATEHIPQIIDIVRRLIERGHAYQVEGDVYFDVSSFPEYGKLSKRNLDDLKAGARVEVDERKQDPLDFALWKAAKPGEPWWESPWGRGRPGWHIECSAMSTAYLGQPFDLHGGGKDLVFPHHENEIAQSEAAFGRPFVHAFFHNGFVNIDKEKMSKSLGNFFTIREIIERYHPEALRYFVLTTHYRSPLNFEVEFTCPACGKKLERAQLEAGSCPSCGRRWSEEERKQAVQFPGLEDCQRRVEYLYATRQRLKNFLSAAVTGAGEVLRPEEIEALEPRFRQALDDDFNTAQALAVLADAARLVNEILDNRARASQALVTSSAGRLDDVIGFMAGALGILEREPEAVLADLRGRWLRERGLSAEEIERLVAERNQARREKDFKRADAIRERLAALGIELMDGAQGTSWRVRL